MIHRINDKKLAFKEQQKAIQKELDNFKDFFKEEFSLENIEKATLKLKEHLDEAKQNKTSLRSNIGILTEQIQFVKKEIENLIQEEQNLQEKIKENINHKSQSLSLLKKENKNQFLFDDKINQLNEAETQVLEKKSLLEKEQTDLKSEVSVLAH